MHKSIIIALIVGLTTAIIWPLVVYLVYPTPPESIESVIEISKDDFPHYEMPRFLIGVRGLLTLRSPGFRTRGIPISVHHRMVFLRTEAGEVIIVMFMSKYRSVDREHELSSNELIKLISSNTTLKGHIFLTRRGLVLIPIEIIIENKTFIAVPPYR
ncbi:MAG: hypothetical protein N3D82_02340 [Ignisphaera sp.]|nr:hypothetical protein [Ignisphaera sp.]MCX8167857.1 hypothetical protein [Ignisphaera sp.]MDW8086272.1 hypothetical protein [Ignisphaera sp.]